MNPTAEIFARTERLAFRRLDEQTVIVDPRRREVHVLNGTGTAVWELLSQTRTLVDLVAALEHDGSFDAGFETVARDLREFLGELAQKGLVTVTPP
jgi:threonine dehydratase